MIFLTVGTQLPFDRLVLPVFDWCNKNGVEYVFQVGESILAADNVRIFEYLNDREYRVFFEKSKLVISHAGMGTILRCLSTKKPLIVMPRRLSLGEHRNDHQFSTVQGLSKSLRGVACDSEAQLLEMLNRQKFRCPVSNAYNLESFARNLKREIF